MNTKSISKVLPGKLLTIIQSIVCLVLILVICAMSFLPIFTLKVDMPDGVKTKVEEIMDELGNDDLKIPETIDVSLPFIVKSVVSTFSILDDVMEILSDVYDIQDSAEKLQEDADNMQNAADSMDSDIQNAEDNKEELEKKEEELNQSADELQGAIDNTKDKLHSVLDQDILNLIVLFVALFYVFTSNILLGFCNVLLFSMVFIIPITTVLSSIRAIIGFFTKLKDPGRGFHKVAKAFSALFAIFPLIFVVMILVPEIQFAGTVFVMLALCCVGLGISLIASRLKYYEKPEFRYINVLQIVSLCSLGAFLTFFFAMTKSSVVAEMFGHYGDYLLSAGGWKSALLPLILMIVFVVVLILMFGYMTNVVTRLACMSKSKSDNHIVTLSVGLLAIIIPIILMKTNFALAFSAETMKMYIISSVGIGLMFACEIVMAVLGKTLCANAGREHRADIVTGAYIYVESSESSEEAVEEKAVAEEAVAAEAVAAEVAVEEAVVEEAVAEETVAEETVVEEAVVEEAVAEEAVAEEAVAEEAVAEEAVAEEAVAEEATEEKIVE